MKAWFITYVESRNIGSDCEAETVTLSNPAEYIIMLRKKYGGGTRGLGYRIKFAVEMEVTEEQFEEYKNNL